MRQVLAMLCVICFALLTTEPVRADNAQTCMSRCVPQVGSGAPYDRCLDQCFSEDGAASPQWSRAARYLIDEQLAAACPAGGLTTAEAVYELDLTGDGRDDLVIDHRGFTCEFGGQSGFCGAQLCSVLIYVREGRLLRQKLEMLSARTEVRAGRDPHVILTDGNGRPKVLRWRGGAFR